MGNLLFLDIGQNYDLNLNSNTDTRGSNFWSSKVCEKGESRDAYTSLLIHPNFSEINDHVTQTHFWSALKLIENLLLVQFELMKVDQK